MEELAHRLDSSRWTSVHGLIFTSTSLGMFIWGLESMIGLVRVVPIASYDISLYVTSSWSEWQFVTFNIALWDVGAAVSLLWRLRGYDARRVLLESVSSPKLTPP